MVLSKPETNVICVVEQVKFSLYIMFNFMGNMLIIK
jgi:hypothetical protein